jgi:hypothetical protein
MGVGLNDKFHRHVTARQTHSAHDSPYTLQPPLIVRPLTATLLISLNPSCCEKRASEGALPSPILAVNRTTPSWTWR